MGSFISYNKRHFITSNKKTAWPSGRDGALVINNTTVNLTAGAVKDYSSISITNNGSLNIQGDIAWTIIGCLGNCTIDATSNILCQINTNNIDNGLTRTAIATAPDGTHLSGTFLQNFGGDGGGNTFGVNGGSQFGNGGGGAGFYVDGQNGRPRYGGDGGQGDFQNGFGAVVFGLDGGDAETQGGVYGDGGGGASCGQSGNFLYMKVAGTISFPTNLGTIDIAGTNGGNGGQGDSGSTDSGGGGGGAAGGNGGILKLRYKLGSWSSTAAAYFGGIGGTGGIAFGGAGNGADGDNGNNGTLDVATY